MKKKDKLHSDEFKSFGRQPYIVLRFNDAQRFTLLVTLQISNDTEAVFRTLDLSLAAHTANGTTLFDSSDYIKARISLTRSVK